VEGCGRRGRPGGCAGAGGFWIAVGVAGWRWCLLDDGGSWLGGKVKGWFAGVVVLLLGGGRTYVLVVAGRMRSMPIPEARGVFPLDGDDPRSWAVPLRCFCGNCLSLEVVYVAVARTARRGMIRSASA